MDTPLMQVINLKKCFFKGLIQIPVLRGVNLDVRQGEFLSIIGHSGSGKSTLLHLMGLLAAPSEGEVWYRGKRVDNLGNSARDLLRNQDIAMIFQFYHLLPELNMLENVMIPMMISQGFISYLRHKKEIEKQAEYLLEKVGLAHRMKHKPSELSGGEMQRTAIARALINKPKILLADEPTGNLDRETERGIITILRELNATENLTTVLVTHNPFIADGADRVVRLTDGILENSDD